MDSVASTLRSSNTPWLKPLKAFYCIIWAKKTPPNSSKDPLLVELANISAIASVSYSSISCVSLRQAWPVDTNDPWIPTKDLEKRTPTSQGLEGCW